MSDFKLSIITINRNNAEGLRKTIESVLSQPSLPPEKFEYIIVDGASTDNSVEVIKEFESRTDLPLKITSWTSEPDTGIYNAMNKGIKKATGTLVGIMNSGDTFLKDAFEGLEEIATEHPKAILYGAFAYYKNNEYDQVAGGSASKMPRIMLPHNACFVPNLLYKSISLYDEDFKICADHELFVKFYTNNIEFIWLEKLICTFETGGVSQTQLRKLKEERHKIAKRYKIKKYYDEIKILWAKRISKAAIVFLLGIITSAIYYNFF